MATLVLARSRAVALRAVPADAPWHWLAAGWRDLGRAPGIGLLYGLGFALISAAITGGLWLTGALAVLPALAGGFLIVAPLLAVGLYEVSRRLERGEQPTLRQAILVRTRSPAQLAFLGALLMLLLLFWMHLALVLFALFLAAGPMPQPDALIGELLFTTRGLALLAVGTLVGGMLAALAFAVSVISVPLLMDREIDAVTAILTSLRVVRRNWKALALWAWLITLITACGLVTCYLGLIVTFPLIGHATWHAYRALTAEA